MSDKFFPVRLDEKIKDELNKIAKHEERPVTTTASILIRWSLVQIRKGATSISSMLRDLQSDSEKPSSTLTIKSINDMLPPGHDGD